jgi:trimeric autotransporter adhesin
MKKLVLCVLLLGVSLLVGCGGSGGSSSGGGGTTASLVAIQVTPLNPSINAGATEKFAATGAYSDGSTKDLTATANWLSSSTAVATINTSGLATGVSAGTSTITASLGTISGNTVLTVTPPVLVSIAVTPATFTVDPNGTKQFTATGTYASGPTQDITASVTWSASVGATITAGGLATGTTPGATSTIMATSGSISGTATLTVTNPLISIAVTPATASLPTGGFNQLFTATGTYAGGPPQDITSSVTWTSSNPAIATISSAPNLPGQATSVAPGTTQITAMSGSITSPPATLTVIPATLVSISVTAPSSTLSLLEQQQYTAEGTFTTSTGSTTLNITSSVTWTSSDPTKVKIVVSGFATGLKVTSTPVMITASKGAITSPPSSVTVDANNLVSIAITPSSTILAQGTSRAYAATGTLLSGSTLNISDQATWSSSNTAIATVATGLVRAAASVGSSTPVMLTAALGSVTQSLNLTVTNATVSSLTVTPITASIPVGATQPFTATATFSSTTPATPAQDVSSNASWSSDNTAVATANNGAALGVHPGTANITATFGGLTSTPPAQLTVTSAIVTAIAITPATANLAPGSTVTYLAVGTYSDLSSRPIVGLVTWTSTAPTVVSITQGGIATGQSAGTATITATYQGITSNASSVLVTPSPLASIAVTPSTASVPEAVATQYRAKGTFVDGSTQDLTTNATWASSPSSVATISNATLRQGLATGVAPGTASITAVFASKTGTATLSVTTATIQSITVTTTTPTVAHGATAQFIATGHFSDTSTVDLTNQVTWSSSNVTVATINSVGQANAASPGTTMITATFNQNGTQVSGTATLTVN